MQTTAFKITIKSIQHFKNIPTIYVYMCNKMCLSTLAYWTEPYHPALIQFKERVLPSESCRQTLGMLCLYFYHIFKMLTKQEACFRPRALKPRALCVCGEPRSSAIHHPQQVSCMSRMCICHAVCFPTWWTP